MEEIEWEVRPTLAWPSPYTVLKNRYFLFHGITYTVLRPKSR
jgi:hypothetical protein